MRYLFLFLALLSHPIFSLSQEKSEYEVREHRDLQYLDESLVSNDSLQRLNLAIPVKDGKFPLLIWVGGGAWSYVDRDVEMDFARMMARQGIAVASVGHRLSPAIWKDPALNTGVQHPAHVEDLASSVKWLYDQAENYGYDKNSLFIGGFSSGAHLSALVSMDGSYLKQKGLSTDIFQGIIPISGAYDMEDYHKAFVNGSRPELAKLHVEAVFGNTKEDLIGASPTSYLENLRTPMLLITDNTVYNYTKLFEDRIRASEFQDVQVAYSLNFSHAQLWRDMSFSEESLYRETIIKFINSQIDD